MGAEITWLGPVDPADQAPIAELPELDDIATGETCDRHPAARAEFWSPEFGLTFCGHCARYGAARMLQLVPIVTGE